MLAQKSAGMKPYCVYVCMCVCVCVCLCVYLLGSLHGCVVTVQLLTQLLFAQHMILKLPDYIVWLFLLWQWHIAPCQERCYINRWSHYEICYNYKRFLLYIGGICGLELFKKVATNICLLNSFTLWIAELIRRYSAHTGCPIFVSIWYIPSSSLLQINVMIHYPHT